MPDYVLPISFKPHEQKKLESFLKSSEFKTKASLIKEALFTYIDNPEYRNPIRKNLPIQERMEEYLEGLEEEDKQFLQIIDTVNSLSRENDITQRKIDLILGKLKIGEREIKKAEKRDTSMEDIHE